MGRYIRFLLLIFPIYFLVSCSGSRYAYEKGNLSLKELETVVSNVSIDRYSYLLGDIKEKKGNDGIYEVKILCKTFCPNSETALNQFVKKFYKIYCVYGDGKPITKEEIVKLPEKIKKEEDYWKAIIFKLQNLKLPEYYKNKYIEKAKKRELPILLPVSRIYQVYTPVNCSIVKRNLIFFVKPAEIDKESYDEYININYIKTYEVIDAYAEKLVKKIEEEIKQQIEKDKKTFVWVSTEYDYVKDGLVLKHFLAKPEMERISIEFTLENPTNEKKIFNLTDLMFKKDGQTYPVVYLDENGEIKGVSLKGGCKYIGNNKIEIEPYKKCFVQYGGKLWAKGVIIPGIKDLDGGVLKISGYNIGLRKKSMYYLKSAGIYWK